MPGSDGWSVRFRQEFRSSNYASHVATCIGNGQIIHATSPDSGTIISDVNQPYYKNYFLGGRRC